MATHEEHILRILREATRWLFPSEVAELLNHELRPGAARTDRLEPHILGNGQTIQPRWDIVAVFVVVYFGFGWGKDYVVGFKRWYESL